MKPTHQSRDLLILKDAPWVITIIATVFALIFLALALVSLRGLIAGVTTGNADPKEMLLLSVFFFTSLVTGAGMPVLALRLLLEFTQVRFDRPGQFIEIRRRQLYKLNTRRIPLKDIKDAYLEPLWDVEEENVGGTIHRTTALVCRPVLRLRGRSEELPLLLAYSNAKPFGALVDTINDWLNQSGTYNAHPSALP